MFICKYCPTWLLPFNTNLESENFYHEKYFVRGTCGEEIGVARLFCLVKSFI